MWKRKVKFIRWDEFPEALEDIDVSDAAQRPLSDRVSHVLEAATEIHKAQEAKPSPVLDPLNLWASRLRALQKYRNATRTDSTARDGESIAPRSTTTPNPPEFGTASDRCRARGTHRR